jgi:hypothetical protein
VRYSLISKTKPQKKQNHRKKRKKKRSAKQGLPNDANAYERPTIKLPKTTPKLDEPITMGVMVLRV